MKILALAVTALLLPQVSAANASPDIGQLARDEARAVSGIPADRIVTRYFDTAMPSPMIVRGHYLEQARALVPGLCAVKDYVTRPTGPELQTYPRDMVLVEIVTRYAIVGEVRRSGDLTDTQAACEGRIPARFLFTAPSAIDAVEASRLLVQALGGASKRAPAGFSVSCDQTFRYMQNSCRAPRRQLAALRAGDLQAVVRSPCLAGERGKYCYQLSWTGVALHLAGDESLYAVRIAFPVEPVM